ARTSAISVVHAVLPFLCVMLLTLLIIVLVPGLSTWLPATLR
ncbi:hypothetical protein GW860_00160, partial [bacterium]|nr:hypothetical protein [bacterium]